MNSPVMFSRGRNTCAHQKTVQQRHQTQTLAARSSPRHRSLNPPELQGACDRRAPEQESVKGRQSAHVEEVEDGAELPHAAELPAGQLRGRLGLRHERRDHAALRRVVRAAAARRRRRGAAARALGRRRGRGFGLAVARAREARLPRGRLLLLCLRRRRRPLRRVPRRLLFLLLLLPLLQRSGRGAPAPAVRVGHGAI